MNQIHRSISRLLLTLFLCGASVGTLAQSTTKSEARVDSSAGFNWDTLSDWEDVAPLLAAAPKLSSRRWTGYYVVNDPGTYEIAAQGPGEHNGFRLYLDDKLLFDNWDLARAYQEHAAITLEHGPHKLVVEDVQRSPFGGRMRVAVAEQQKLVTEAAKKQAKKADAVVIAV